MNTTTEVLDLSAISPPRDRATLKTLKNPAGLKPDGSEYELANLEDFSPVQITQFNNGVTEAEQLWTKDAPTVKDRERMEQLYTDLAQMVILESPRKDVAQLPLIARRSVVMGFWAVLSSTTFSAMGTRGVSAFSEMAKRASAITDSGRS